MRLSNWFLFLTLVLSGLQATAAPVVTHELDSIRTSPKSSPSPKEPNTETNVDRSTLQWETADPLTLDEKKIISSDARGTDRADFDASLRIGYFSGVINETRDQKRLSFIAARFDFNKRTFETWQAELKFGSENFLHATLGKKFPFLLEQIGAPYYRFAGGAILDSSEGLGSIFNFKKLQAIAAIGLDDFFLLNNRLQMELAVGAAMLGPQFEASLGFAF